ncbi:MAG: FtsQ-type POTRA domain-containing protein [Clostridia bacterium]|nr:FtsQ-type POTRA domain-containing protein [Clostridia bacterium]
MQNGKDKTDTPKDTRVSMTRQREKKERRKRIIQLVAFVSCCSLVMIVIIMTVFMKVNTIEVVGNVKYSDEEIISASLIEKGRSLIAANGIKAQKNICEKLPAVEKVKVIKNFPSTVTINVTETAEVLFVAVGEHYYSLDADMNVIQRYESIETAELMGLKRIYLPGVTRCITGEKIKTEDNDIPEMVKTLYVNLLEYDLFYDISEIDFRDKFEILFTLGVKYTVKLGSILECDTKLEFLRGIISKLSPEDVGTIDFSDGNINEAVFSRS